MTLSRKGECISFLVSLSKGENQHRIWLYAKRIAGRAEALHPLKNIITEGAK